MLSLFQDLFVRMFIIVTFFDVLMYFFITTVGKPPSIILLLWTIEMVSITISLWFDLIYRGNRFKS
jgi:hypothetical protein